MPSESQRGAKALNLPALRDVLNGNPRDDMRRILGLSPREFAIAIAIAEGCSRSELAVDFRCSPHTVDSHIRRIFSKLDVRSKAAIGGRLIWAYHAALVEEGEISD